MPDDPANATPEPGTSESPHASPPSPSLPVAPQEWIVVDASPILSSRQVRRAELRHRTKLFGGKATAEEIHRSLAFPRDARCACGGPPAIRILSMMPLDEMEKRDPVGMLAMRANPGLLARLLVDTRYGKMLRVGTVYACDQCTALAERVAARLPDHVLVDIQRGPGRGRIVSGPRGTSGDV